MKKWLDRLTKDCKHWYKLWSSWLAILWGFIVAVLWTEPTILMEIANTLPEDTRALLSPMVMLVFSGLPILIRLLKQQKLIDKLKAAAEQDPSS